MMKLVLNPFPCIMVVALIFTASCTPQSASTPDQEPVSITVSAAASLTEAFTEIGELFEDVNPEVSIIFNFAGSQELAQQINEGAQVDVFACANKKQMDVVVTANQFPEDGPVVFAQNQLAVIFPSDNPGAIKELADLAKSGLKLVFAGSEVPVGLYSLAFLDNAEASGLFPPEYKQAVLDNIVSYENNVRAILTKVSLGEADGGIVYATDIVNAKDKIGFLEIPTELNVIATYPILALPNASQLEWGQAFVDFILSDAGQQVMEKYGFSPVQ
ncbi:MAG: molybdate ABC transporter substrate-binding protein [Bellilinea sp.]